MRTALERNRLFFLLLQLEGGVVFLECSLPLAYVRLKVEYNEGR